MITTVPGHRGLSVGYKVILPFLALSLVAGLVASTLVGIQISSAAQHQLDAEAVRQEDSVETSFATFEQRQLTNLRSLVATSGVPAALSDQDTTSLRELMLPLIANQLPDPLRASAINLQGRELLSVRGDPSDPSRCICSGGRDLHLWPHVMTAINNISDRYGPKYVGVAQGSDGPVLYTISPVPLASGASAGAILVAEPLQPLLNEVKARSGADIGLYRAGGTLLAGNAATFSSHAIGATEEKDLIAEANGNASQPVVVHHTLAAPAGHFEVFYVPWRLRHEVAGYAALVVPAAALGQAAGNIPLLLGSIFIGVFILTLLTGIFVTRGITRPLANLVRATREVGAGNLQYQAPVISADEVGVLTESFNDMTRTLFQQQLERDLQTEATVQTLAATIDARDRFTHGHSLRVAAYSKEMARAAGFVGTDVDVVRRGCLVHDIGKIGIPDAILGKPGPLTDDERTLMQHHPEIGYQMLRHLEWPHGVMDIVLYHHERWDGEGYPSRLAGENIPLLARLVGVSDTLDAMTSDRPYRKGFTFDRAADEIRNNAGKQFDPAMVAVFEKIEVVLKQMVQELQNPARPADLRELTRALAS